LGKIIEVLWGELNLKSVWDILEGITIGSSGQVYIMDPSGRYIAHRQIDRVVTAPPLEKPDILKTIRASDRPATWIEIKDGARFFCMGSYVPGLDWVIVLQQPLPEIYTYLYRNIFWAIILTAVICLAVLLIGWNRVKLFLAPIHTLHQQVLNIGRGDLEQKVSIDTHDEIGDLGLAFNEMTDSLKEYIRREVESAKELTHAKNLAVLGTTSSKVTHEVGNLLNNIGTALSLLQREVLSPKGAKMLEILAQESTRVRTFIYDFLQFAKKPDLQLQQTPLDNVIKEAIANYQPEAEQKGVRLELNWSPQIPWLNIDPRLMYQVVNNLVKNSLDAMAAAGVICFKGNIDGQHLQLAVEDTGSGISPEAQEKIFDPFFTTKGSAGTGLGMAIVKTIVEAHRGTIDCRSELNKGTTVIVRLPLR
jgi:signal transduction histidine kinase